MGNDNTQQDTRVVRPKFKDFWQGSFIFKNTLHFYCYTESTVSIYCLKQMNTFPEAEQTERCWEHHFHRCTFESWSNLRAEPRPAKEMRAGTTMGTKVVT